jgi:23S rRNA pseudouridine2605 synthase
MEKERLQKILAQAGYGSRRSCEEIIRAGRVRVDGRTAKLGDQADPETQRITVDETPIARPEPRVYVMFNKPRGVITSTQDPHGRKTVLDFVVLPRPRRGESPRLYPVGRLDYDSEGLLLLTNDGRLTQRLTHPSYEHPRTYRVLVEGEPDAETLERWKRGITLDDRSTRFDAISISEQQRGETWLEITVHEGRKHLVRRMVAALGHPSKRLIRVSMGPLKLGTLASGKWRYLSEPEVRLLQRDGAKGAGAAGRKGEGRRNGLARKRKGEKAKRREGGGGQPRSPGRPSSRGKSSSGKAPADRAPADRAPADRRERRERRKR